MSDYRAPDEDNEQAIWESFDGGRLTGVEGGLRHDVFDHDQNSKYDFSDDNCMICELPENTQDLIINDIEQEDSNG